jgi:hypothetical protein
LGQTDGDESRLSIVPALVLAFESGTVENETRELEVEPTDSQVPRALPRIPLEAHPGRIQLYIRMRNPAQPARRGLAGRTLRCPKSGPPPPGTSREPLLPESPDEGESGKDLDAVVGRARPRLPAYGDAPSDAGMVLHEAAQPLEVVASVLLPVCRGPHRKKVSTPGSGRARALSNIYLDLS